MLAIHDQAGARRAIEQNPALRWSVPGPTSQLWVDSYAIPKDAPHLDAVYSFLNYELTEKAQITDTRFLGYPTGSRACAASCRRASTTSTSSSVAPGWTCRSSPLSW